MFIGGSGVLFGGGQAQAAPSGRETSKVTIDHAHAEGVPPIEPVTLQPGEKLQVTASTTIIGDVLQQIAGSVADVQVLMAIGQDPHTYEPAPRELARLERAHIVFVNGFDLEEGLLRVLESVAQGPIVPVSANIAPLEGEAHDDEEHEDGHDDEADHNSEAEYDEHNHEQDPHVWFSVANVKSWVEIIATALSDADPKNEAQYQANARSYLTQLETLDQETRQALDPIPQERRVLVTGHGVFGYFARDYGFRVVGTIIPSTSTQAEASARQIAQVVQDIREYNGPAIFVGGTESQALQNLAQIIQQEAGTTVRVKPTLTGSLTPQQPTYIDYFRYNVQQIVEGLSR